MSPEVQAALAYLAEQKQMTGFGLLNSDRHIEALAAEVRRLEQDAKRLDWLENLRSKPHIIEVDLHDSPMLKARVYLRDNCGYPVVRGNGDTFRAAIDAAMKGTT